MLLEVYKCVQLNRCSVVCGCFLQRGHRGSGFRRLCVDMKLGWDFYSFQVGRGCDVFLKGERVQMGKS